MDPQAVAAVEDDARGPQVNVAGIRLPGRDQILRLQGVAEAGADADIAIFDTQFRIVKTFVGGRLVFESETGR